MVQSAGPALPAVQCDEHPKELKWLMIALSPTSNAPSEVRSQSLQHLILGHSWNFAFYPMITAGRFHGKICEWLTSVFSGVVSTLDTLVWEMM